MKKIIIALCFLAALGVLVAAVLLQKIESTMVDPELTVSKNPKLLSDIDIVSYVSLPVFKTIKVNESYDIDQDDADKAALDKLLVTAKKLESIEDDSTAFVDITVSNLNEYVDSKTDVPFYVTKSGNTEIYSALSGKQTGEFVKVDRVDFESYGIVDLQFVIGDIYAIPYPVTDSYMKANTNYSTFYEMKMDMVTSNAFSEISEKRAETLQNLIPSMIKKTTFMSFPDSLCKEEYAVLQSQDPDATYEDARESLKKIFFIATVVKEKDLASSKDMDERAAEIMSDDTLSEYEKERGRILLYEEDVIDNIYKSISIEQVTGLE